MAKNKTNPGRPTDKQLSNIIHGRSFKHCESCGAPIISSACYCGECLRTTSYGMAPAVPQFRTSNDTQQKQSFTSNDHSGYSDRIPSGKFPASKKERV